MHQKNKMSKVFVFVLLCALLPEKSQCAEAKHPNILWISAEDTSLEYGCYGDIYARTPSIDALASRGLRFTNCFAEAPICSPSRFTLITGMHTGPMGTSPMRSAHRIPDYIKGFPTYFRDAGYYCTNNVKTDYNTAAAARIIKDSWNESSVNAHWRNRAPGQPFFAVFNYMDTHSSRASQYPYEEFRNKIQSRLSPGRIFDPAKAPLPPYYPDTPIARRTVARYYDCISTLDDFVKARLDELGEAGEEDNTIVVFFGDNGAGIPRAKCAAFENGVRVPLIIWLPKKYQDLAVGQPGSVVSRLVCFADFAPTMLSLAGIDIPAYMQGKAFLGPNPVAPPQFVVGIRDRLDETLELTRWLNDGRYHYVRSYLTDVPFDQHTLTSFYNAGALHTQSDGNQAWLQQKGGGEFCREIRALKAAGKLNPLQLEYWSDSRPMEALYDGEKDPLNLKNLATLPEYRAQLQAMRRNLHDWILNERDLGFWPEPELSEVGGIRAAPFDEARKEGVYPIKEILSTAELVGSGELALPLFRQRLRDPNSSVRYWAAVGIHALKQKAGSALPDLKMAMEDSARSVRIEAAWAVADLEDSAEAMSLLVSELDSANEWAACRAARALAMLGEKTRPYLAALRGALARARAVNYGFEFSLRTAIGNLSSEPFDSLNYQNIFNDGK